MGFVYPIRLTSIEGYIRTTHGSDRPLTASEIVVLSDYADRVLVDIEDDWPVDTATSVDSFSTTLHTQSGYIGFDIENDADYAQYIHRKGGHPENPLYLTLIPSVLMTWRDSLLKELQRAINKTEAEIRNRNAPPSFWARRPGA